MDRRLATEPDTTALFTSSSLLACCWRGLELLRLWRRNSHTRRQLANLDARLLADAGISEAQRRMELEKPFWR